MQVVEKTEVRKNNKTVSMRQIYRLRLYFRIIVAAACFLLYFLLPGEFNILKGWNFFRRFSWLHLFWLIWMFNMVAQLLPGSDSLLLGSKKQHARYYSPAAVSIDKKSLARLIRQSRIASLKVAAVWILLIGVIAGLKFTGIIDAGKLLLITAFFYVSDIICVLFWCPFQTLIMKNRCCTTCMIFNWDHMMIFSPAVLIGGFYAISLFIMSMVVLAVWEIRIYRYPQRFFDQTNSSISCQSCTDRLCEKSGETG